MISSSVRADDPVVANTTLNSPSDGSADDSTSISCPCTTGTTSGLQGVPVNNQDGQEPLLVTEYSEENVTGGVESLLTREAYDKITNVSRYYFECWERDRDYLGLPKTLNGQWYYTYENMTQAMNADPKFAKEGDINTRKLEIAAFLANVAQETGSKTAGDPYGGPGCQIQEDWGSNATRLDTRFGIPPVSGGPGYCGRGPHQLTYLVNYRIFGNETGKGDLYYYNPDLLTQDPLIGIGGSLWFWGHSERSKSWPDTAPPFKPSAHDVVVGRWQPTNQDINCGRSSANFGIIINIINGGVECGHSDQRATNRVNFLIAIAREMGVTIPPGFAVDCAGQQNFQQCPSYLQPSNESDGSPEGQPSLEMVMAPSSSTGKAVVFNFNETPATSQVAIQSVSYVPNQPVPESQCIIDDNGPSPEFALRGGPAVYKTIEINWVNPSAIDYGTIRFGMLGSWLRENSIDPADVVLMRQHDFVWSELPTEFDHQTADVYYYKAITPGFSYFAVTGNMSLPVPTTVPEKTGFSDKGTQPVPSVSSTNTGTINPTTAAPPDLTPEKTGTPVPAAPAPGPVSGIPALYWVATLGILVVVAVGAVIGRRWYQRRQNPKLFGKG